MFADRSLSDDARQALQILVGLMIPASREYGVPGADDPAIFDEIVVAAKADFSLVADGLKALEDLSIPYHGEGFAALDDSSRVEVAHDFARAQAPYVSAIVTIAAQYYYSDARVMRALGMEVRAPFPEGFAVEQGDWSLLDPVKQRPKFYRKV